MGEQGIIVTTGDKQIRDAVEKHTEGVRPVKLKIRRAPAPAFSEGGSWAEGVKSDIGECAEDIREIMSQGESLEDTFGPMSPASWELGRRPCPVPLNDATDATKFGQYGDGEPIDHLQFVKRIEVDKRTHRIRFEGETEDGVTVIIEPKGRLQ